MTDSSSSGMAVTDDQTIEQSKKIVYSFDRYEIEVLVTETGKFIGIVGIKVNADFLTQAQKLSTASFHDVEKYYREEDK